MVQFDLGQVVGADGKGIVSIELISTSGKNKTYRITFTDESYFDYTVKDGDDAISAIVTAWEQTLSDTKVASEKLTKDTLDTKVDKVAGKGLSTEDYTAVEKTKLAGVEAEANKTVVDSSLSSTSENPVQNKIVKGSLDLKANSADLATVATTGDYDDLLDKPNLATVATTGDYDDLTNKPFIPPGVVVDQSLDSSSTNAVANQAVVGGLNNKAETGHLHDSWTEVYNNKNLVIKYNSAIGLCHAEFSMYYNFTDNNMVTYITDIPAPYRPPTNMAYFAHPYGHVYISLNAVGHLQFRRPSGTGSVTIGGTWVYIGH